MTLFIVCYLLVVCFLLGGISALGSLCEKPEWYMILLFSFLWPLWFVVGLYYWLKDKILTK